MRARRICANTFPDTDKRDRPVDTAFRLRSFALVEWYNNALFPFSWNSSRGPHIGDDLMQSFTDWFFSTFQKFCSYAICTCSSTILQSSDRSGYFMQHRYSLHLPRLLHLEWPSSRICEIIKISWGSNIWMIESVLVGLYALSSVL